MYLPYNVKTSANMTLDAMYNMYHTLYIVVILWDFKLISVLTAKQSAIWTAIYGPPSCNFYANFKADTSFNCCKNDDLENLLVVYVNHILNHLLEVSN